jgi:prolyl-tRNA editing enzyme YbaK/EbsC (Cys-tRNA(Pro) deacylase)
VYDLPVYLDVGVANETMITFPAGSHSECVHMRTDDLRKLTQPKIVSLAQFDIVAAAL